MSLAIRSKWWEVLRIEVPGETNRPMHRGVTAALVLVAFLACFGYGTSCAGASGGTSSSASTVVYRFGDFGSSNGKVAPLAEKVPTAVSGVSGMVVQIATSNSDGYTLTSNGAVYAWGVNDHGELGNGKKSPYDTTAVRVSFPAGIRIVTLANPMPFDGALAIDSKGNVWAWGFNAQGDLCLPPPSGSAETGSTATFSSVLRPTRVPLGDVTLATGALTHSLFDSDGRVYACGSGQYGVLGDGSTTSRSTPTAVIDLPTSAPVTALTSSWGGAGALLGNGAYYNWGYNVAGQLGNGSTINSDVPVHVHLPSEVSQVFQGGSSSTNGQTVTILADGSVWTWGNNQDGQLGDGSRVNEDVPVAVTVPTGVTFVKVNSGGDSSYAIDASGRLWAWGGNDNGQLGTGSSSKIETRPVDVGLQLAQVSSTAYNVAGFDQH